MAHIHIRTADTPDADLIADLAKRIWEPHYTPIIGAEQVAYMLSNFQSKDAIISDMNNGCIYDIAYVDHDLCGYCAVRDLVSDVFLSKLYVREDCRGLGVARSLLKVVSARMKESGQTRIWLKCNKHNTDSLAAYRQLGFVIKEAYITDIGDGFVMDDYELEKIIG